MSHVVSHAGALDTLLFHLVNGVWVNPVLDLSMPFLSLVGSYGLIWMALLGMLAILGGANGRWAALAGLIALGVGIASSEALKELTMQPRPFLVLPDVRLLVSPPRSYAFPSGHAADAFAASSGAVLSARRLLGRVPLWGWGLLALATAISYSRIYVGVHFPSDVLGGVVLETLIGWLVTGLLARHRRGRTSRGERGSGARGEKS